MLITLITIIAVIIVLAVLVLILLGMRSLSIGNSRNDRYDEEYDGYEDEHTGTGIDVAGDDEWEERGSRRSRDRRSRPGESRSARRPRSRRDRDYDWDDADGLSDNDFWSSLSDGDSSFGLDDDPPHEPRNEPGRALRGAADAPGPYTEEPESAPRGEPRGQLGSAPATEVTPVGGNDFGTPDLAKLASLGQENGPTPIATPPESVPATPAPGQGPAPATPGARAASDPLDDPLRAPSAHDSGAQRIGEAGSWTSPASTSTGSTSRSTPWSASSPTPPTSYDPLTAPMPGGTTPGSFSARDGGTRSSYEPSGGWHPSGNEPGTFSSSGGFDVGGATFSGYSSANRAGSPLDSTSYAPPSSPSSTFDTGTSYAPPPSGSSLNTTGSYSRSSFGTGGQAPSPYDTGSYSRPPYDTGGQAPSPYDTGSYSRPPYDTGGVPHPTNGSGPMNIPGPAGDPIGEALPRPATGPGSSYWASPEPGTWRGSESISSDQPTFGAGGFNTASRYGTGGYPPPDAPAGPSGPGTIPPPSSPPPGMEHPAYGDETGVQPSLREQHGWHQPGGDQPVFGGPATPYDAGSSPHLSYDTGTYPRSPYDTGSYPHPDPPGPGRPGPRLPASPYSPYADGLGTPGGAPPPDPNHGFGPDYDTRSGEWPSYGDNGPARFDPGSYRYGDGRFG